MNSISPYLLRLVSQFRLLTRWQYFQPGVAVLVFLLFFVIGRKSYESKFTHVLNTINDCENEKKRLTFLLGNRQVSLTNLDKKLTLFKGVSVFIVICVAVYIYIKKFNAMVILVAIFSLILMWLVIYLRRKYLSIMIKNTETSLKTKMLSSQADAKEMIALLGNEVCQQLKTKFERELDVQWRNEEIKDCDLRKCQDQKTIYRDLHKLYKDIIGEMQKMQWCDICSQRMNTDANQIKLNEFQTRMKNYHAVSQRLSLDKKKQLTNKLLEEWQRLEGRLPFMCRRGCCIRFRHSLEEVKKNYHQKLKSLKNRLSYIKN